MKYKVDWYVDEMVLGDGEPEDAKDGTRRQIASGHCVKEAECAGEIETELGEALRDHFPERAQNGYQDLERTYQILVTELMP